MKDPALSASIAVPTAAKRGFLFDIHESRIRQGASAVQLRPKTFAVLSALLVNPGELVLKDDLMDAVWGRTVVGEDTLTRSIRELRIIFGDDARAPRFIETVHRRGFRLIARVNRDVEGNVVEISSDDDRVGSSANSAPSIAREKMRLSLVGRSAEMAALVRQYELAANASPRIVFVTGEAGIGKTAIVDAMLDDPALAGARVARGQAIEQYGAGEPYLPVLEAVGRLADGSDGVAVVDLLRRCAPNWLAQMPWLVEPEEALQLRQLAVGLVPQRMLREFALFLEELARHTPVVVFLEDLHWCDPSTVEILSLLAQRGESTRWLVVATYRHDEIAATDHPLLRAQQTLLQRRRGTEIALSCLRIEDVEAYVALRFPGARLPPSLSTVLHAHSGGNPLFLSATIDQIQARGWLVETQPGWALTVPVERIDLSVPDCVGEMIRQQLGTVPPRERLVAESASVIGEEFSIGAAAAAAEFDLEACEAACVKLADRGRFFRTVDGGDETLTRGRVLAFRHALYRMATYENIPGIRRQRIHARVAAHLEDEAREQPAKKAAQIAFHYEHGADFERATTWLGTAAAEALQVSASREAIRHIESALAMLPRIGSPDERREREIDLRILLGSALNLLHGLASDKLRENCERGLQLCCAGATATQRFEVLYANWYRLLSLADDEELIPAAEQLEKISHEIDSDAVRWRARSALGRSYAFSGQLGNADAVLASLLSDIDLELLPDTLAIFGADPVVAALGHRAWVLAMLGRAEEGRGQGRSALALADRLECPFTSVVAQTHVALMQHLFGESARALETSWLAVSAAAENGFEFWHGIAEVFHGSARVHEGEVDAGSEEMCCGLKRFQATGARLPSGCLLALLADGYLRKRDFEAGLQATDKGLEIARTTSDRFFLPELWRLRGELLRARGQDGRSVTGRVRARTKAAEANDEARDCVANALEICRETAARGFELRALSTRLRWDTGTSAQRVSREALSRVVDAVRRGGDTAECRAAAALLA